MSSDLRIGELASAAGVSPDTVRYYERRKLLPRAGRTIAGYRVYSDEDVGRLHFIRRAQSLGLSLDEIETLVRQRREGLEECRQVRDLLSSKLADLNSKIAEMHAFRRTLSTYLKECEEALEGRRGDCCPVLFEIASPVKGKLRKASKKKREKVRIGL